MKPPCTRILFVGLLLMSVRAAVTAPADEVPRLHVPRVKHPPVIDGVIAADEYRELAALTGMVRFRPNMVVPAVQQVTWYLGYDAEYLYLAMRSPNPPGSWPRADIKPEDAEDFPINRALLEDDHVEIQIGTFGRAKAALGGYGFFKLIVNPRGALTDTHYYNGTPGSEDLWSYGGDTRCTVDAQQWQLEMRVSLKAIGIEEPDGKSFPLQLVRADSCGDSIYYAGWVGAGWMDWNRFGEVVLDPDAPAMQFLDCGEMAKGEVRLAFTVNSAGAAAGTRKASVTVTDGAGKTVCAREQTAAAPAGGRADLLLTGAAELTPYGNTAAIAVTWTDPQGRLRPLYEARLPLMRMTPELWAKDYAPWLAARPQTGNYKWTYAYWPSHGLVRANVDLDLFGLRADLAQAAAWSLSLYAKGQAKPLAEQRQPLAKRRGMTVLETGALPEGDYEIKLRLYGAKGDDVLDEKTATLTRRKYAWEGNTLGKTNRVIPPYTPIKADGMKLSPWGRTYTIGAAALPAQIRATGGRRGEEDLLRSPIRIEAIRDGKAIELAAPAAAVASAGDARVEVQGTGVLAGAAFKADCFLEFDGWYQVRLTLDPGATPCALDRLTLVLPVWAGADTMYVQRGDGLGVNRTDAIPSGTGVVWHSGQLPFYGKEWGSFAPVAFAGNGDKGLWWFAVDNRDWTMSAETPALEYVRGDAGVDMRVNLLAARTTVDRPRVFEFALQATPVKPYTADYRRIAWQSDAQWYGHSTEGYRTYGTSVDGFELYRDEDYTALKDYLQKAFPPFAAGKPMVLYGSTWMCGLGLDAFDTYGGEWLNRSNWQPAPDTYYKGRKNMQGTLTFETPRQLTPLAVPNWTDSFLDCFVWYQAQLMQKTGMHGTWWDNSSIGTYLDYDPARKEFYRPWNVFMRRKLTKRLATLGWELNREPWWLMNMHVDFPWCQVAWHVENDFNPNSPDGTILDELTVDQFRALCRIKRGIIEVLDSKMSFRNVPRHLAMHQARTSYGLALLHDIGGRATHNPGAPVHRALLDTMTRHVDFYGKAEFLPYWDNADMVTNTVPGTHISVYRDGRKAVLVIVNTSDRDIPYPRLKFGPALSGGKRSHELTVADAETGDGWRWTDDTWFTYDERHFQFEKHGLMLLTVEWP